MKHFTFLSPLHRHTIIAYLYLSFLCLLASNLYAQQPSKYNQCSVPSPVPSSTKQLRDGVLGGPSLSSNGGVFTPKGDLRVLVIHAGFINTDPTVPLTDARQYGFEFVGTWPVKPGNNATDAVWNDWLKTVPSYVDPINGDMPSIFFRDNNEFSVNPTPSSNISGSDQPQNALNVSNFYYTMSNGAFRLTGEPFKDPATGKPVRINIDPLRSCVETKADGSQTIWDADLATSYSECNMRVMVEIKKLYPNFNWGRYDNRINKGATPYTEDNSATLASPVKDGIPDYVVIVYRNNKSWVEGKEPAPGMEDKWFPRSTGGYAKVEGINPAFTMGNNNQYRMSSDGFIMLNGENSGGGYKNLFIHEVAHMLYNSPHYAGANGVFGDRFNASYGLGMMNYGTITSSALAWESWLLGWIPAPKYDLSETNLPSGTITLGDFITTREAIRIKIPTPIGEKNQYLWIENHEKKNKFDNRDDLYTIDGSNTSIPTAPKGLYMYVESMLDNRNEDMGKIKYGNRIQSLHGGGHHDYESTNYFTKDSPAPDNDFSKRTWDNIVFNWKQVKANPTCTENDLSLLRLNKPLALEPDINKIIYGNEGSANECSDVKCKERKMVWSAAGAYDGSVPQSNSMMFNKIGKAVGLSCNPVVLPMQTFDAAKNQLSAMQLNGISVTIISYVNGVYTLDIKFNDTDINTNQRYTGNLTLKDIPNALYDLTVKTDRTLTLDKSGTPNRTDKGVNGEYPDFVTPSVLAVESGATMLIEYGATMRVKAGSTLQLKAGSELYIVGNLIIEDGAFLCVDPAIAKLVLASPSSQIIFQGAARAGMNALSGATTSSFLDLCTLPTKKTGPGTVVYNTNPYTLPSNTLSGNNTYMWNASYNPLLAQDLTLMYGAKLIIPKDAMMLVPAGRKINIYDNSELIVMDGATFSVDANANIYLNDAESKLNIDKGFKPNIVTTCPAQNYTGLGLCALADKLLLEYGTLVSNARPVINPLNNGRGNLCVQTPLIASVKSGAAPYTYSWNRGNQFLGNATEYTPTVNANYTLYVTSSTFPCMYSSVTQNIALAAKPTISISTNTNSICGSGIAELSATVLGTTGETYRITCISVPLPLGPSTIAYGSKYTKSGATEKFSISKAASDYKVESTTIIDGIGVCNVVSSPVSITQNITTDSPIKYWQKNYKKTNTTNNVFNDYKLVALNNNVFLTGTNGNQDTKQGTILQYTPTLSTSPFSSFVQNTVEKITNFKTDKYGNFYVLYDIYMIDYIGSTFPVVSHIRKTNSIGVQLWNKPVEFCFGEAVDFEVDLEGNIYVVSRPDYYDRRGSNWNDFQIIKMNNLGEVIKWQYCSKSSTALNSSVVDLLPPKMVLGPDNNLHIGFNFQTADYNAGYVKYDQNLNTLYEASFIGVRLLDISILTSSRNESFYVAIGGWQDNTNKSFVYKYSGGIDGKVFKEVNSNLTTMTNIQTNFSSNQTKLDSKGNLIVFNSSNGVKITKIRNSESDGTTNTGKIVWEKSFSFSNLSSITSPFEMDEIGDIYFVTTTTSVASNPQTALVRISGSTGNIVWQRNIDKIAGETDDLGNLCVSKSGNVYHAQKKSYTSTNEVGVSVTKYEQCTGTSNHNVIREGDLDNETQSEAVQVYPNPFQGSTNIGVSITEQSTVALEVFNAQGVKLETIFSGTLEAGNHAYQFNAKNEGMYYLRTTINKKTFANKLVLLGGN